MARARARITRIDRGIENAIECHAKWENAEYGAFSGCMVNTHDGLVPERNVIILHWNDEGEIENE